MSDADAPSPGPAVRVHAPGRVNLIGDHTDYVGGLALPMAIDLGTTLVGRRLPDRLRLSSEDRGGTVDLALPHPRSPDDRTAGTDLTDRLAGAGPGEPTDEGSWGAYAAAVVAEVGRGGPLVGFEGRISTTLPIGAGLSSSAALEVAIALAVTTEPPRTDRARLALAEACQEAEQRASGVPCGLMDQLCSVAGIAGHALLVDFRARTWVPVPVPHDVDVVVVHSGQPRRLATSGYGQRRDELARAEAVVGPLRDAGTADLTSLADPVVRARARHVVAENERVVACAAELAAGDLRAAGARLVESHASLRDDFAVSTPVVDQLVERLVATPGVYGARMVGGGFGGCVVALAEPGALSEGWTVRAAGGATVTVGGSST